MTPLFDWRAMTSDDIGAVSEIAAQAHPDFFEEDHIFAERQRLAPHGCHILWMNEVPTGYVLSHPWKLGSVPALNVPLGQLPPDPDTFYIHDLALLPAARGSGAAGKIIERTVGIGEPYGSLSLVAVNNSVPFWARFGFVGQDWPGLSEKLKSYDDAARYMVRPSSPLP
ncbi:GNAT family N-acetyltransferase [Pelagibacterium lentulum]|uniref:N-acetyltransferase n=1 Tax=Pelagibacterium lentulum TaxID=2029865 RepID=A0A916R8Q9_9HYPH|nr:GNAT family N-acetyltransferase [Pelagibacterium lentulum]GGA42278.1 N-acetyltransferase [Pelagibacterium lentulum]